MYGATDVAQYTAVLTPRMGTKTRLAATTVVSASTVTRGRRSSRGTSSTSTAVGLSASASPMRRPEPSRGKLRIDNTMSSSTTPLSWAETTSHCTGWLSATRKSAIPSVSRSSPIRRPTRTSAVNRAAVSMVIHTAVAGLSPARRGGGVVDVSGVAEEVGGGAQVDVAVGPVPRTAREAHDRVEQHTADRAGGAHPGGDGHHGAQARRQCGPHAAATFLRLSGHGHPDSVGAAARCEDPPGSATQGGLVAGS